MTTQERLQKRLERARRKIELLEEIIEEKTRSLYLANQELEARVAERTAALEDAMLEAQAASHAKTRFLASMSHELRTPLNAIIGYSELLLEDTGDQGDVQYHEDLHRVLGASHHLLELIGDVLDLSEIEAGRVNVVREEVDLDAMLDELESLATPLLKKRHNRFERTTERLERAWVDGVKLRQVLLNLLSNASKFTERGLVTLRARRTEDTLTFEVSDTGVGISAEDQERIFDLLGRAHDGFHPHEGSGLGLAISRQLMRAMSGNISLESEFGVGSTFTVTLPLLTEDPHIV